MFAKSHEIMGQIVYANITTNKETDNMSLIRELRVFCNANLPRYKVPVKFNISVKDDLHNARFKKSRNL